MHSYLEVWGPEGARLVALESEEIALGRADTNNVVVTDPTVSKLHAVLVRYPSGWCVRDLGSSNGTFVNGEQVVAEHRVGSGDEIRLGSSRLVFRTQDERELTDTVRAEESPHVTRRERDVLVALCQPMGSGEAFREPASVKEIAGALVVSEAAVKQHLSNLYDKFAIYEGKESRRVRLANEAIRRRAVTLADLQESPER